MRKLYLRALRMSCFTHRRCQLLGCSFHSLLVLFKTLVKSRQSSNQQVFECTCSIVPRPGQSIEHILCTARAGVWTVSWYVVLASARQFFVLASLSLLSLRSARIVIELCWCCGRGKSQALVRTCPVPQVLSGMLRKLGDAGTARWFPHWGFQCMVIGRPETVVFGV